MEITESVENYLETILIISKRKSSVYSIDIVHELNYSKPSVSIAMKLLRENDYIRMDEDNRITLTETGRKIAETIYERHLFLAQYFMQIGVDQETAFQDACKIEHVISPLTFSKIKEHAAQRGAPAAPVVPASQD
jgi:Mn-dependent DtxR family transcriptional regulator